MGEYGSSESLHRHAHSLFGGRYGAYRLERDIVLSDILAAARLEQDVPYVCDRGTWIHTSFGGCKELIDFVSEAVLRAENLVREKLGVPERGKGWSSETEVFLFTKDCFAGHDVYLHYSPEWLSPQHLDVYVPHLRFGIEYQGSQHYKPVSIFGGEEGFVKTQARDKRKAYLCKKDNVRLLYIRFDDENAEHTILDFAGLNFPGND